MAISDAERLRLLEPPRGRVRVILDTDAFNEIDDQFALTQMLLSPERFDVEGIHAAPFLNRRSESPGHGMELSHGEILRLLELLGVPPGGLVHRGATGYVGPEQTAREAPAVDHMIARARAGSPDNPLYVVAIAAASNVASALLKAPDIHDRVVVVWLGGHALEWPHTAEFNLEQDIGAARVLFDCGVPLVLVPCMGVASHLHSTVPEIERHVEPMGDIGAFLAKRFKEYSKDHVGWAKAIWDMAPVSWLLNPDWAPSAVVHSPVLTELPSWSVDPRRHFMRYVWSLDRTAIMRDFFNKLEAFASG